MRVCVHAWATVFGRFTVVFTRLARTLEKLCTFRSTGQSCVTLGICIILMTLLQTFEALLISVPRPEVKTETAEEREPMIDGSFDAIAETCPERPVAIPERFPWQTE